MSASGVGRAAWWALIGILVVGVGMEVVVGGSLESPEFIIPISMYALVGAVIASHRPDNPIGWIFLAIGGLTGLMAAADVMSFAALDVAGPTPWWGVTGAWLLGWVWYPLVALMTLLTFLFYPSGLPSPRWRPLAWLTTAGIVVLTLLGAIQPLLCLGGNGSTCKGGRLIANPLSPWLRGSSS